MTKVVSQISGEKMDNGAQKLAYYMDKKLDPHFKPYKTTTDTTVTKDLNER